MAIRSDGSLWGWGANWTGELGIENVGRVGGDWISSHTRVVPTWVMNDVVAVSTSHSNTMAIRADGSLWGWGGNWFGQVGTGTSEHQTSPTRIMDNVTAVSAGGLHTMAIRSDGSLWGWGAYRLHLGEEEYTHYHENRYYPVRIMDNVLAVSAAGGSTTVAIRPDGSVVEWGLVWGDEPLDFRVLATRSFSDIIALSAGNGHAMVIKSDGSLWGWGGNWNGQISYPPGTYYHAPVQIRHR